MSKIILPLQKRGLCTFTASKKVPDYMGLLCFPWKDRAGRDTFPQAPNLFKQFPGVRYQPKIAKHIWVAPIDALRFLQQTAHELDLTFESNVVESIYQASGEADTKGLYPFQKKDIPNVQTRLGFMLAWEMGLGKSAEVIRALESCKRVLVICPAVVKTTWLDQLNQWTTKPFRYFIRLTGKDIWPESGWTITSPGIIDGAIESGSWDAIILDESHFYKNGRSKRTKAIKTLREANPLARVVQLTGTPIANSPEDLHAQLDILYPDRYGTIFQFRKRHCNAIPNPYAKSGWSYEGLRDEYADELKTRLGLVSSRVTKQEVASYLPPLTVTCNRLHPETYLPSEEWASQDSYEEWLYENADKKVSAVTEWAELALESSKNVLIFTHLRKTAASLAKELKGTLITGAIAPEKRNAAIKKALKTRGAIVATIASVGIGIDALAGVSRGAFAELSYYPMEVLQAMARMHRLSSRFPVDITLFIFEGTVDEKIALTLDAKLADANKVLKGGVGEEGLSKALEFTPENWEAHMADVAAGRVEDILSGYLE